MLMSLTGKDKGQSPCPVCRRNITLDQLTKPIGSEIGEGKDTLLSTEKSTGEAIALKNVDIITFDSKLKVLMCEIRAMRSENPNAKALIFTQYLHTMELLKGIMTDEGLLFQTLEGHMTMRTRKKNLDQFRNDPDCCVFLLSMRAGSVGLTLTAASHVFILEPCINPALEQQAIGRIHRLGNRHKEVVVKYLVVNDSVEENIMTINAEKLEALAKLKDLQKMEEDYAENDENGISMTVNHEMAGPRKGRFGSYGHSAAALMHSNDIGVNTVAQGSLKEDHASFRLSELEKLFLVEPEAQPSEDSTEEVSTNNVSNNNSTSTRRISSSLARRKRYVLIAESTNNHRSFSSSSYALKRNPFRKRSRVIMHDGHEESEDE
jgi:superfamily II DNA or RNA helicase